MIGLATLIRVGERFPTDVKAEALAAADEWESTPNRANIVRGRVSTGAIAEALAPADEAGSLVG